jgi:multidrug resistance efflux pump
MSTEMADHAAPTAEVPVPRTPPRSEQTYRTRSRPARRRSRLRGFLRAPRTATVVLVLLAAAVVGGTYIVRDRLAARDYVELGNAVLTAQPVPVGTAAAGTVAAVLVAPQDQVAAGEQLARISVIEPDGEQATQALKAPIDGTVSKVDLTPGGVAGPGQPVITLYDPAKLTFEADTSVEELRRLRLGMSAQVTAQGLDVPIPARLERVVPQVGDAPTEDGFTVVLVPDGNAANTVRTLVPGLPFTATVDTKTAVGGTPAVNSAS